MGRIWPLLITLFALTTACSINYPKASDLEKTIYVSDQFSLNDDTQLYRGADMWQCATNRDIRFHFKFGTKSSIYPQISSNDIFIGTVLGSDPRIVEADKRLHRTLPENLVVGLHMPHNNGQGHLILLVVDRIGREKLSAVVAHEIGHALNLEHVADERSIMHGTLLYGQYITEDDVENLCDVYGCEYDDYRDCR